MLVQVVKEPLGHQGRPHHLPRLAARAATSSSCPPSSTWASRARSPTTTSGGGSRRMLKEIRQERGGGGFIARTAGQGRSREDFERDARYLAPHLGRGAGAWPPASAPPAAAAPRARLVQRLLRDLLSRRRGLDPPRQREGVPAHARPGARQLQPELAPRVRLHPARAEHPRGARGHRRAGARAAPQGLAASRAATSSSTRPRPWWRSTSTPAATSGKKTLEETILKTNLEAVQEIVRQIRLRDLGGIIVRRLHRHGGAQEPPEGDGGARAGAAPRPLAVEDAFGERVRPGDPDPQARASSRWSARSASPAPTARAAA